MSRIVQFKEFGGPEVLQVVDVEIPAPGRGEIRIKVKAFGVNRAEMMWRSGAYIYDVNKRPRVPPPTLGRSIA